MHDLLETLKNSVDFLFIQELPVFFFFFFIMKVVYSLCTTNTPSVLINETHCVAMC